MELGFSHVHTQRALARFRFCGFDAPRVALVQSAIQRAFFDRTGRANVLVSPYSTSVSYSTIVLYLVFPIVRYIGGEPS